MKKARWFMVVLVLVLVYDVFECVYLWIAVWITLYLYCLCADLSSVSLPFTLLLSIARKPLSIQVELECLRLFFSSLLG